MPDGGFVYSGRADSLMKRAGQWMDVDALQDAVSTVPGVTQVAVIPGVRGIDVFVALHSAVLDGGADTDAAAARQSPAKKQCL